MNINLADVLRPEHPLPHGVVLQGDMKQTYTGKMLLVGSPTVESIDWLDIAMGIAGTNRFDAHTRVLHNVATHSMLATKCAGTDALHDKVMGMTAISLLDINLHDAHEFIVGDVSTPVKNWAENAVPGFKSAFKGLTHAWDRVIYKSIGIEPPDDYRMDVVKTYDTIAMFLERDAIMATPPCPWALEDEHHDDSIYYPDAAAFIEWASNQSRLGIAGLWLEMVRDGLTGVTRESGQNTDDARRLITRSLMQIDAIARAEMVLAGVPDEVTREEAEEIAKDVDRDSVLDEDLQEAVYGKT